MSKAKQKSGVRYPSELCRQMVELVCAGRKASELEREFWGIERVDRVLGGVGGS